jgi:hypothetical protein
MAIFTPAILLSFLYFTAPALSLFKSVGPVPLLNPKSFDEKIRYSKHASIVIFFAPWFASLISVRLTLVGVVTARSLFQTI